MPIIKVKNLILRGSCVARNGSMMILENHKLAFDCGVITHHTVAKCGHVFITHGHTDHIGALHQHAFIRDRMGMKKPVYIMPKYCIDPWTRVYTAIQEMTDDIGKIELPNLISVPPSDTKIMDPVDELDIHLGGDLPLPPNPFIYTIK